MAQPSVGPFMSVVIDGDQIELRWDSVKQSPNGAMDVVQLDSGYSGVILRIRNEGSGPVFRLTKGGVDFDFVLDSGDLVIRGDGTEVLRLGTSKPVVTGVQTPGSVAESLTNALATLGLITDSTT